MTPTKWNEMKAQRHGKSHYWATQPHSRPWEKVGIDIFTLQGQDYLVTEDYLSGYFKWIVYSQRKLSTLFMHFASSGPDTGYRSSSYPTTRSHLLSSRHSLKDGSSRTAYFQLSMQIPTDQRTLRSRHKKLRSVWCQRPKGQAATRSSRC